MHYSPPMFDNKRDIRLWKKINSSTGKQSALNEILNGSEPVHSAILVKAIQYLDKKGVKVEKKKKKGDENSDETPEAYEKTLGQVMNDLVLRSRSCDCLAGVEAAKCMLNRSEINAAYDMINAVSKKGEILHTSLTLAEIRILEGDSGGAKEAAMRAYYSDPSVQKTYDILKIVDVAGEWPIRQAIQAIYTGEEPPASPATGSLRELYSIYSSWFRGNRSNASDLLAESEGYAKGDREYILAAARMSASERDWTSAKKQYLSILDGAPQYLRCEIAEALLSGGEPVKALEILRKSDQTNIRVLRDTVRACAGDGSGLKEAVDNFISSEFADGTEIASVVRLLISASRIDEAERILSQYLEQEPGNSDALALMSEIRLRQDKLKNAVLLSKKAAHDRKNIPAKIQRARMMFVTGDVKAADKKCSAILRKDPFQRDALVLKRDICIATENYKEALEICKRILDTVPGDAETLIAMSEAYSGLGSGEESAEFFKKALRADLNWDNSRAVIESLIEHGLNEEAIDVCGDLYKEFPDNAMLRRLKGNAEYSRMDYSAAVKSYSEALTIDSNDPVVWHSKGMAEEAQGDYVAAENSYNRAVILDLSEPEYWISKACIQDVVGDRFGAVESLNRAIELNPESVFALVRKAMIFDSSGRTREAIFYMEMALTTVPDDKDILREIVRMCIQSGVAVKAIPYAEHLYKLSPSDSPALYAKCMILNGETKKAMQAISRGLNDNPKDATLLRCKYDCLMLNKDYSQALSICDMMESMEPNNADIKTLKERAMKGSITMADIAEEELGKDQPELEVVSAVHNEPEFQPVTEETTEFNGVPEDPEYVSLDEDKSDNNLQHSSDDVENDHTSDSLTGNGDDVHVIPVNSDDRKTEDKPNTDAMLRDAEAYFKSGNINEATSLLYMVIDLDPKISKAHALLGRIYYDSGKISDAIRELDMAIFQGTDDHEVYSIRGNLYESVNEFDDAMLCYQKAVTNGSEDPEIYRSLSYQLNEHKDYRGAMKMIRESIYRQENPYLQDVIFYAELGKFCGDDDAIKDAYDIFGRLNAGAEDTVRFMHILEKSGHSDEASEMIGDNHVVSSDSETKHEYTPERTGGPVVLDHGIEDEPKVSDVEEIVVDEEPIILDQSNLKNRKQHNAEKTPVEEPIILDQNDSKDKSDVEEIVVDEEPIILDQNNSKEKSEGSEHKPVVIDASLKKRVASVLRYAYSNLMDPMDPDVYENCNISESDAEKIIAYLGDIPDYGRIDELSRDFEMMEMRSMDIILKCNLTELDSGKVPIEAVFSKGGCSDVDDAKKICSYIRTAALCDAETDNDKLVEIAMQVPHDAKLFDIIRQFSMGIYSARAIQLMARNM